MAKENLAFTIYQAYFFSTWEMFLVDIINPELASIFIMLQLLTEHNES